MGWLTSDPAAVARLQQWKGLFFVLATAALIWWLVRRSLGRVETSRDQLASSERHFRHLFEKAPTAYQSLDGSGLILVINEAWLDLLGIESRDEVIGRHIGDFLEASQLVLLHERFPEFKTSGRLEDAEFVLQRPDGGLVTVTVDGRIETGEDGSFQRTHCVLHDITARKEAENALRESEHQLSLVLSGARLGTFHWDLATGRVNWSERQMELYGATPETFEGTREGIFRRIHPDDRDMALAAVERGLNEGCRIDLEYRTLWDDGSDHWVLTSGQAEFDESGRPIHIRGITMDNDARKRAEMERDRMAAELRLRTDAIEKSIAGFQVVDSDGQILYSNRAALKMWGYDSPDEVEGTSVVNYAADPADVDTILASVAEGKEVNREFTGRRKDGSTFRVWMVIHGMHDAEGNRILSATTLDVSDRHELEEQLRQSQKMEAVGQLAGGVAHDFNNLLQVINGYSDMVLDDLPEDDPLRKPLAEITAAGGRAARLVSQLLAFSRRQVLDPTDVDLNEVIDSLIDMAHRTLGEHIEIDWLPGRRLGTVTADRGQLEQVLMNLWINARDAMPEGGTLTIETENVRFDTEYCQLHAWARQGHYVLLSITDSGEGMDQAVQERIWEPFFTTKPPGRGTGLGLSTVYGIVRQHDGLIHLYSEPGRGTTFKIYLPLVERPAADVGDLVPSPAAGGEETILVAEDSRGVRELVRTVLERAGYQVVTVNDGEAALAHLREHGEAVDLVLLDVVMPGLGGREVYDRIKNELPQMRFIFASGYSLNGVHTNFVLDTGFALLQKPFEASTLLARVRRALDRE